MQVKWLKEIRPEDADDGAVSEEQAERVAEVKQWLADLEEYEGMLTGRQQEFVDETRERLAKYGDRTRMSDKQYHWLKGIWERHLEGDDSWGGGDVWEGL